MRLEMIDGVLHAYVRQSWLNTALDLCLERSRRDMLAGETPGSDAALLGTGVHGGIEAALLDREVDYHEAVEAGQKAITDELAEREVIFHDMDLDTVRRTMPSLLSNWWTRFRMPTLNEGVLAVEHKFEVELCRFTIDLVPVIVHLEGTIDCVTNERVWDWKTAGQEYKQWEKQRWAIQPSTYAETVVALQEFPHKYPVRFTYGIMLKKPAKGNWVQEVDVIRTRDHAAWLAAQIRSLVELHLNLNPEHHTWPLVDSHALCSEKWCAHWHVCKGAYLDTETFLGKTITTR